MQDLPHYYHVVAEAVPEGGVDLAKASKFTEFKVNATLTAPPETDKKMAHRLHQKAETSSLITNSLAGTTLLPATVMVES